MRIFTFILSLTAVCSIAAQAPADSISLKIYFPIGKSEVDLQYGDNSRSVSDFLQKVNEARQEADVDAIHIVGYASPDGAYRINQRLAAERAASTASFLKGKLQLSDSLFSVSAPGIDWEGLYAAVGESSLPNREQVQSLIRNMPEFVYNEKHQLVDSRKKQLMMLDYGRTWNWMLEHIFPQLRSSSSQILCTLVPKAAAIEQPLQEPAIAVEEVVEAEEIETVPAELPMLAEQKIKYPVFAIRSNLLLPLLNVGVELPIGNRWSIAADYYYPWVWPKSSNKNCFELLMVSAEARYWFGSKHSSYANNRRYRLTGHSVGVYGAWGYYDIEHNYKGHQGHGWSAGLDYMFAMPIAKGKLHLEFELALGYVKSGAKPYTVYEEGGQLYHEEGRRKNINYFGPTKAAVSLVIPINRSVKVSSSHYDL